MFPQVFCCDTSWPFESMQYTVVWVTGRRLELNEVVADVITGAGLVSMEW